MSHVDNYTIATSIHALDIESVNGCEAIAKGQYGNGFKSVGEHAGGCKVLEHDLYAAAFNYPDEEAILSAIHCAVDRDEVGYGFVCVIIHREHDDNRYTVSHWTAERWDTLTFWGPTR